jgi:HlyD family secretion protein
MTRERHPAAGADAHPPMASTARPAGRGFAWKLVFLLALFAGLGWAGVAYYPALLKLGGADAMRGALTCDASRSSLQITVTAEGNVESASNIEVKCRVAGGSTILWIVEDGKIVEEGEEIIRLDTSAIDDKLNSQRIVYEKALATQIQAQEDFEAAKISVREYEEGTFIEQFKQVEADIQIAMENLRSAENQLDYSKRMVRKGFTSSLQREADEFAVGRAKLDLDAANTRKKVLVEFTKLKTLKDLEAKREAAAARLRSEQAGLQLEKARLDRLQEQLKNCVITAPKKGMIVYANDSDRGGRGGGDPSRAAQVEEGALVRESQALVRLPDLSKMRVKVSIHESHVDKIRVGMPAHVVIQDQGHDGRVLSIANQPASGSWFSAKVKEYATMVSIDGESTNLKPGMTAKVTILVDDLTDALCLPVSAIVEQRGQFFCWAKTPEGPERRPLKLGRTNDKLIEIVDGVREGETVFRNPRAVVEEAREEPPFEKQSEDAKFKGAIESAAAAEPPAKPAPPADAGAARGLAEAPSGPDAAAAPGAEPRGEGAPEGAGKRGGRRSFDLPQLDKDGDGKLRGDGSIDASEFAAVRSRRPGGGEGGGRGARGGGEGEAPEGSGRPVE